MSAGDHRVASLRCTDCRHRQTPSSSSSSSSNSSKKKKKKKKKNEKKERNKTNNKNQKVLNEKLTDDPARNDAVFRQ